jgi:ubiquinone/menaquinone biosynthesis C-methylase UbiE
MSEAAHHSAIIDQFTRQAEVFNVAPSLTNEQVLQNIIAATQAGPDDTVLDVACGGGVVLCAFAPHVNHATGIDMTPAMLNFGRELAAKRGLANVTFKQGDVATLPFPDGSFSVVVTRYTFHHFLDPLAVFKEMLRVCRRGGRIAVVDMYASEDDAKAAQWNRLELLRDPSHARCLPLSELKALFGKVGLEQPAESLYGIHDSVKNLLGRSFPNPGDDAKITAMFAASVRDDSLGIPAAFEAGELWYTYPTAILSAVRH